MQDVQPDRVLQGSPRPGRIGILLADDQDLIRETLASYIEDAWPEAEVTQVETLEAVIAAAGRMPDLRLAVLDNSINGHSSTETLDTVRSALSRARVVLLSDTATRSEVITAFDHGASGVIPKTLKPAAMVNALKLVLCGERYLPATILDAEPNETWHASDARPDDPRMRSLTTRERAVLSLLTSGSSNKEIARALSIQEITVKSHMKSIFRKLNTKNRTQAAKIALDLGFTAP